MTTEKSNWWDITTESDCLKIKALYAEIKKNIDSQLVPDAKDCFLAYRFKTMIEKYEKPK